MSTHSRYTADPALRHTFLSAGRSSRTTCISHEERFIRSRRWQRKGIWRRRPGKAEVLPHCTHIEGGLLLNNGGGGSGGAGGSHHGDGGSRAVWLAWAKVRTGRGACVRVKALRAQSIHLASTPKVTSISLTSSAASSRVRVLSLSTIWIEQGPAIGKGMAGFGRGPGQSAPQFGFQAPALPFYLGD